MKRSLRLLLTCTLLTAAPIVRAIDDDALPPSRAIAPTVEIDTGLEDPREVRLLNDGVLVAGTGGVTRHDVDGARLWHSPEGVRYVRKAMISADRRRIIALGHSEVWSLDADSGVVLWALKFMDSQLADALNSGGDGVPQQPSTPRIQGVRSFEYGLTTLTDIAIHPRVPDIAWVAVGGTLFAVALDTGGVVDEFTPEFPIERFTLRHGDRGPALLVGDAHNQVLHLADDDETRVIVRPGQIDREIEAFAYAPGGALLIGGRDWGLIIDAASGTNVELPGASAYSFGQAALARDVPRMFLPGQYDVIDVVDLETGDVVGGMAGHLASPRHLRVSGDGTRLLSAADDLLPRLWDTTRNLELGHLTGHRSPATAMDFYAERQRAATVDADGVLRIWDLAAAQSPAARDLARAPVLTVQRGHSGVAIAVAASPDGQVVASGQGEEIILWDRATGLALRRMALPREAGPVHLQFLSPTRLLSVDRLGFVRYWDVGRGVELRRVRLDAAVSDVGVDPGGALLATGAVYSAHVTVFDIEAAAVRTRVRLAPEARAFGYLSALALSADGGRLALGGSDGRVVEYDLREANPGAQERFVEPRRVNRLVYSADGALLAAGGTDRVSWYATDDFAAVDRSPAGASIFLAFDAGDAALIALGSGGFDSPVQRIDLAPDSREERDFETFDWVRTGAAALLPGGGLVLTSTDGALLFQAFDDDAPAVRIPNPVAPISDLAFSDDGASLAVATASGLDVWSLADGHPRALRRAPVVYPYNTHSRIATDGGSLLILDTATLRIMPLDDQQPVRSLKHELFAGVSGHDWAIQRPGTAQMLVATGHEAMLLEAEAGASVATFAIPPAPEAEPWRNDIVGTAFSADGRRLVLTTRGGRVHLFDVESGATEQRLRTDAYCMRWNPDGTVDREQPAEGFCHSVGLPVFSPDGQELAIVLGSLGAEQLLLIDLATSTLRLRIETVEEGVRALAFSRDGQSIATGGDSGLIRLWDRSTGAARGTLAGHRERVTSLAFSPDGRLLASGGRDSATLVWDLATGEQRAELVASADGDWAVTAADGRYDASDPGSSGGLFWVLVDDPLRPLPIELFFKDYYEPRLLPRLLAGEEFPIVTPLASLNRDQPEVQIVAVEPDPEDAERLRVSVHVRYDSSVADAAVDAVKLFRDGQLVGQVQRDALARSAFARTGDLTFSGVQQPGGQEPLVFSSYAFNEDGIKSRTATLAHERGDGAIARPRRAFVISVGVNRYENPAWNLFYAGNDARVTSRMLRETLARGAFDETVPVLLLADRGEEAVITATRPHLEAVLAVLGGQTGDAALLAQITGAERLVEATPDDTLIFTFSGHGFADRGRFHFFLHDIGPGAARFVDDAILARALDSDRFSEVMLGIDAGTQVMIIDACNSAASVNADGFRPGPMGSRGLGQMAYDKRMMILASSQAEAVAIESAQLRHGIMSYALLREGLDGGRADFDPIDGRIDFGEWARWGVRRVPEIYGQIFDGSFDGGSRGVARLGMASRGGDDEIGDEDDDWEDDDWEEEVPPVQQPSLFDFRMRKAQELTLETGVVNATD